MRGGQGLQRYFFTSRLIASCDLLVPQSVDERVEHWSDNRAEEGKDLVPALGGASPQPHVGNDPCPQKECYHKQVAGTCREDFLMSLGCHNPKNGDKNRSLGHYDQ